MLTSIFIHFEWRLGLGARITPNAQRTPSTDPVERKLLGKVNAKRKQNEEKMNSTDKNELENDYDTDEPESRTNAVAKKRPMPLPTAALVKRRKWHEISIFKFCCSL
jgi:Protein of unknown function (DUF3245)